jgi:gamma-glutamylcyclotransferase (GGCT)/AIG2-like uncharacterized protein YtfP
LKSDYPAQLFVYGTLRRDPKHEMFQLLAKAAHFVGEARVAGRLYDLGAYPGMAVEHDGRYVRGELYEIDPSAWSRVIEQLDEYEGCSDRDPKPHEYSRELVKAQLPSGQTIDAWAYVLKRSPSGLPEIPSGDYLSASPAVSTRE